MTVGFSPATSLITCAVSLGLTGAVMGFVSIATLIIVQKGVGEAHLGVATSTHQFTRTLGGTIGVGICGNIATIRFAENMDKMIQGGLVRDLPPQVADLIQRNFENLFRPDIQAVVSADVQTRLFQAMGNSIPAVFQAGLIASLICLFFCYVLPGGKVT